MSGHTPGPFIEAGASNWYPDRYSSGADIAWTVIRSDDADQDVAIVMTEGRHDAPEFDANIRLFCAATDLLAALKDSIGALELDLDAGRDSGDSDWEGLAYQRLEAARATIARATASLTQGDGHGG